MTRATLALLIAFSACVVSASWAAAATPRAATITVGDANAIALRELKPISATSLVYGMPTALPKGASVSDAGPEAGQNFAATDAGLKGGATLTATVPVTTLSAPGWLYWEDENDGADFPHTSEMVLVDAATGHVTWAKTLSWWPMVNFEPAVFNESPVAGASVGPRVALASDSVADRAVGLQATPATYPHDCLVALYDSGDPRQVANFSGDATAMVAWAQSHGLESAQTGSSVATMNIEIAEDVANNCTDVVVYIAGHGTPAVGSKLPGGETAQPTVILAQHLTENGVGPKGEPASGKVIDEALTATDLKDLAKKYLGVATFKFLINSCYSGRFVETMDNTPGVYLTAASSDASQETHEALVSEQAGSHPGQVGLWTAALIEALNNILDGKLAAPQTEERDRGSLPYLLDDAVTETAIDYTSTDTAVHDGLDTPTQTFHPPGEPFTPTTTTLTPPPDLSTPPTSSVPAVGAGTGSRNSACMLNDGNSTAALAVLEPLQRPPAYNRTGTATELTKTPTGVYILDIFIPKGTPALGIATYTPPPGLTLEPFATYAIVDNRITSGLIDDAYTSGSSVGYLFPLSTCGSPNPGSNGGTLKYEGGETVQVLNKTAAGSKGP